MIKHSMRYGASFVFLATFSAVALADQNPFSQLREGVYREDCAQKSDSIYIIEQGGDKISGIDKSCKFASANGASVTLQCTDEDGDKYAETYNVKVNSQTSFGVWMTGYDPYEYLLCKG